MKKRDFLSLFDLSLAEARDVFARTTVMKHAPVGSFRHLLAGDSIAVVLEKSSTRTRVSFEAGIRRQPTRAWRAGGRHRARARGNVPADRVSHVQPRAP
jgi:ornithine carbamoyltransferase